MVRDYNTPTPDGLENFKKPLSIYDFISGYTEEEQEGILFGNDDPLMLLYQGYIPYYMRNITSGPHKISLNTKAYTATVSSSINHIVCHDEGLERSFGGVNRKTLENTKRLKEVGKMFESSKKIDLEQAFYAIMDFCILKYGPQGEENWLPKIYQLLREKTIEELRGIGNSLVGELLRREKLL